MSFVDEVPPKMFNCNVTCDILLGFVKSSFLKDVDDMCKQRMVKLGIDIEGVKKTREAADSTAASPHELESMWTPTTQLGLLLLMQRNKRR